MMTSQILESHSTFNLKQVSKSANSIQNKMRSVKGSNTSGDNQVESVKINRKYADVTKVQSFNATFNSVATNIHTADKAMGTMEKMIEKMSEKLETHVKNYPPFLPGSEERVRLLKSFQMFRKQIDKMTIPQEHKDAMRIMADPSTNPEAGEWEISFGENGHHKTITSKEVHTGPTGLDIPELPEGATDNVINDTISRLKNARGILKRARTDLARDISDVAQLKERINQQDDMPEAAAEAVSKDANHILAGRFDKSLTEDPSQLTHLL